MTKESLYKITRLLVVTLLFFLSNKASSQVVVSGATCVTTNLVYQYDLKAEWKKGDQINVCVDGGVLAETGKACNENAPAFVKVKWNEGKTTGKITVSSATGTANM